MRNFLLWIACKWQHDWKTLETYAVDDLCQCERCGIRAYVDPQRMLYVPEVEYNIAYEQDA